jgi:hypothetical protein
MKTRLTNLPVGCAPPPWCVRGAGGWRAISRPKNEVQYHVVSNSNGDVLSVEFTRDGYRERAEIANHIYGLVTL